MSKKQEIYAYLRNLGCCLNCSLRYLCDLSIDFTDVQGALKQNKLVESDSEDECILKRIKSNPCIVCIGLLQDECNNSILQHEGLSQVLLYDSTVFTVSISFPASILVRERSMRLHLEDKFPDFFTDNNTEIPINRVWKAFIREKMALKINKTFQNSDVCDFSINVSGEYEYDKDELEVLRKMQPQLFQTRTEQHRKYNGELFSRKGVLDALARTHSGVFKMHGRVPPDVPNGFVKCASIECKHNSIYIAGRYCKFSRELSQSPWTIDGVKMMETSVQELMFAEISRILNVNFENMKFSSSGREDCDVRCLGKGRPFYIEFLDPKKTIITFNEFREIEAAVNKTPLIKITDLQQVARSDLNKIKEGEESKTKEYNALCICKHSVTDEILDKINNYGPLEIDQKTPIRVLHRRPLATRRRKILRMSATRVEGKPNCFELNVVTQAGTYVKEFIHGDFARTKPSIGEIIDDEVDILALDVLSIDLDWPPPVKYE